MNSEAQYHNGVEVTEKRKLFEVFQFVQQNNKMASGDIGDDKITLYHYTDNDSLEKIKISGLIKASTAESTVGRAYFGSGTYLTSKSPEKHSKEDLAKNNHDFWKSFQAKKIRDGKLDWYVEVKIPKSDAKWQKETDPRNKNRDTYRYKGDLNLKNYDHKFGKHSSIDVGAGGRALGPRTLPRFCNKQRSALLIFRNAPFFLRKKCPRSVVPP